MKKILLLTLLLSALGTNAQTNIIKNGGFESELLNWRGDVAAITPYDKKAGKNSGAINQFVGKEWKGIDQIAAIPKNTYAIEFSAWIKADNIEEQQDKFSTGVMTVELMTASEKNVSYENIASVTGTGAWKLYKKTVKLTEDTKKIRVMLALAKTSGSIYFDEVKAIPISQETYNQMMEKETESRKPTVTTAADIKTNEFANGGFEDGLKSWRGNAKISTTIKKEGNSGLYITSSTNDWVGIDQIADLPENTQAIEISAWMKSDAIKQGKDTWNNGLLNVEFTSDGTTKTSDDQNIAFVTGTTEWTHYKKTIKVPANTKKYRIMIAMGFATGTLFVDDVVVFLSSKVSK